MRRELAGMPVWVWLAGIIAVVAFAILTNDYALVPAGVAP